MITQYNACETMPESSACAIIGVECVKYHMQSSYVLVYHVQFNLRPLLISQDSCDITCSFFWRVLSQEPGSHTHFTVLNHWSVLDITRGRRICHKVYCLSYRRILNIKRSDTSQQYYKSAFNGTARLIYKWIWQLGGLSIVFKEKLYLTPQLFSYNHVQKIDTASIS